MEVLMAYLLTLTEWLVRVDRELFTFIHATASGPYLDWFMLLLRNPYTWVPLYAYILYWVFRRHKRYAWPFIITSLVVFAVTDFTSAAVLKPWFERLRPCYDEALKPVLRNLVGCGGRYGMPSSHASNHFGLASFWFFTITWLDNRKWWAFWLWALVICYAQVYVGKHYPGDVLVGAVLGTLVGTLFAFVLRKWLAGDFRSRAGSQA